MARRKHGVKSHRRWRKLHLALDASSGEIVAHVMTDQDAGDGSQVEALLDQIDDRIGQFTADAAYDGNPAYDAVSKHSAGAAVVIPPRANAAERPDNDLWSRPQSVAISRSSGID
jgi:transposase